MLVGAPRTGAFWAFGAGVRDAPALVDSDRAITYGDLDVLADAVAESLGNRPRLVLMEAATTVEFISAYIGVLRGGHAVLLVPPKRASVIAERFDPDVVVSSAGTILERRRGSVHGLHPDLALLLSTSGSTGVPKLVRLSRRNLDANTASICEYLRLTAADRAITTLPLSYCYGLSVLHTHLAAGASIVLTDHSVTEAEFWRLFHQTQPTGLAGVPHTFELLDRAGFDGMQLPSLRYVTQAGGKMAPERVRALAALGEARGWELFVMYGQTEATARMAYLPPALARSHPHAIGAPVPGGELTIEAPDDAGVGELVFRGPNVMMGYAHRPEDLALPPAVAELRTGDLARQNEAGLFEIVGRKSRFVKPFGLRIDLDHLERSLRQEGIEAACAGDDNAVAVAVADREPAHVAAKVQTMTGLPPVAVRAVQTACLPRLASGKVDYAAVVKAAAVARAAARDVTLTQLFSEVLGVEACDDDSFVSLGGDSLSYVEMSARLEQRLGHLPADWHVQRIGDLAAVRKSRGRLACLDTTVLLRAVAIVLIVGSHVGLWHQPGGAHALFAVAGFNFARFQLREHGRLQSLLRVAIPSAAWIAAAATLTGQFDWKHALFLRGPLGGRGDRWAYWFVEALVHVLIAAALVLAVPAVRRAIQRRPFAAAMTAVGLGLTFRFDLLLDDPHRPLYRPQEIFWLFALGWAAAVARRWQQRVLVTACAAASVFGALGGTHRELIVLGALVALLWLREVPVPRITASVATPVASASLYIYLTHFQVFPIVRPMLGSLGALCASLAVGILVARAAAPVLQRVVRPRAASVALELEEVVERLPAHDETRLSVAHEDDGWAGHPVVVRRHRVPVGASHRRGKDISDSDAAGKVRVAHDHVA